MSKNKKKKLIKVKRVNCCGVCGFFYEDSLEEDNCLNIDANNDYDMDDLSEDTVCPYYSKDGYICEMCGDTLKDVETLFMLYIDDKHIYCEECVSRGIKNHASETENNKIEVIVISTDIDS
jgi:hypothetical protein